MSVRHDTSTAPTARRGAFALREIPSEVPGEQWFLLEPPVTLGPDKLAIMLLACLAPARAGAPYRASIRSIPLFKPEETVAMSDLAFWVRGQVRTRPAPDVAGVTESNLSGTLTKAVERLRLDFLPKGATLGLPEGFESPGEGRHLQVGLAIGVSHLSGVACAFCHHVFSAEAGQMGLVMTLHLPPDGAQTRIYGCPKCITPGTVQVGTVDLMQGGDGVLLSR